MRKGLEWRQIPLTPDAFFGDDVGHILALDLIIYSLLLVFLCPHILFQLGKQFSVTFQIFDGEKVSTSGLLTRSRKGSDATLGSRPGEGSELGEGDSDGEGDDDGNSKSKSMVLKAEDLKVFIAYCLSWMHAIPFLHWKIFISNVCILNASQSNHIGIFLLLRQGCSGQPC